MTPVPALALTRSQIHDAGSSLGCVSVSSQSRRLYIRAYLRVAIWWCQASHQGDLLSAVVKDVISVDGVAVLVTVDIRNNGEVGIQEVVLLGKYLRAHAGVDSRGRVVFVA